MFQVAPNDELGVDFINGQEFKGSPLAWFGNRFDLAEIHLGETRVEMDGRLGDLPAVTYVPQQDGLLVMVAETRPLALSYSKEAKFKNFVDHKGFDIDPNAQAYPFTEVYTRHVKALVQVGDIAQQDRTFGLETEFVALENPYLDDMSDGFDVQILYQSVPRPAAQIEVFEMDPEGFVTIWTQISDAEGRATIAVKPSHRYLLDAVVLRPPAATTLERMGKPEKIKWETLWAALTFRVPD